MVQGAPAAAAPAGYYTHSLSSGEAARLVCSQTVPPTNYYSADAVLTLGSLLFTDTALTAAAADSHYSADGVQYFRSIDGVLVDDPVVTLCNDVALPTILLNFGNNEIGAACALGPGEDTYYIDEVEQDLHTEPYGLTPVPDGIYSEGTNYYTVAGGSGNYTGPTTCPGE